VKRRRREVIQGAAFFTGSGVALGTRNSTTRWAAGITGTDPAMLEDGYN
jgi:hypothetical protein